jgi:hypothetical protein
MHLCWNLIVAADLEDKLRMISRTHSTTYTRWGKTCYPKTVTAAYCLLTNCKQEQLAPTVSANDDGVAFANINEDGQAAKVRHHLPMQDSSFRECHWEGGTIGM